MSDIDNLLAQQGDAELKVFVREIPEVFDPSSQKEAQTSRISLYLSFKGREEPEEIYLGRVIPEKRNLFRIGCRSPDLDYFTEDEHISLQRGLETDILTILVLKYMVRIRDALVAKAVLCIWLIDRSILWVARRLSEILSLLVSV